MANKKTQFYPLRINDIKVETDDCVSIAFDIPSELKDTFSFIPGQYLTFKRIINGEEVRRSYSICSGIYDEETRVAVKKMPFGKFSTFANEALQVNDKLDVMPPMGAFVPAEKLTLPNHYCGIAGGSGITPVMSIIKSVLQSSDQSYFTLFYMNKGSQDIIFKEEVEQLKNKYLDQFTVHHIFTREQVDNDHFFGRIDEEKIKFYARYLFNQRDIKQFFICGPEAMIHSVTSGLRSIGVDAKSIKFELFSSPDDHKKNDIVEDVQECGDSAVRVWVDGEATDFNLSFNGETVLDAALEQGADLPYSCKGGVCSTCKVKILKGTVRMEINYALEDDEVEAGYILTCQSHPTSSSLEVELEL